MPHTVAGWRISLVLFGIFLTPVLACLLCAKQNSRTADLIGSGYNIFDASFSMFGMCLAQYQDGGSQKFTLEYFGRCRDNTEAD